MTSFQQLQQAVQQNCDISDARDNGIYSICTLVLKLRNLYKWENNLAPWEEPDSPVLLDWIEAKENYWDTIRAREFAPLPVNQHLVDPYQLGPINEGLAGDKLVYGAGYGRSMKAIFFLAERLDEREIAGCRVVTLGRELARELAAPFAMLQDGVISIRREALKFYFMDQILEIRNSGKTALHKALSLYGLLDRKGTVNRAALADRLDDLVDREMDIFVYHEVGEAHERSLDSQTLKKIIAAFPASPVELMARSLKDVLADTNAQGLLAHIIAARQETSLGFYVAFLDGLRKMLFPEIVTAYKEFCRDGDWAAISRARSACRSANQARAEKLVAIAGRLDHEPLAGLMAEVEKEILEPLGIVRK